ncbi:MAG TPA: hypothetical protein VFX28_18230, partial [Methylomirabilota bacterium]|nr:hypothetical protein [Methylomirabilota bacterium]
ADGGGDAGERATLAELTPAAPEARTAGLGEVLAGFGPLVTERLVDAVRDLDLYVLGDPAGPGRPLGALALAVWDALVADGDLGGLGPLESVVFREGRQRTVVRPLAPARGRRAVLAAAGPVRLPGLARRQLERAATLVEAV